MRQGIGSGLESFLQILDLPSRWLRGHVAPEAARQGPTPAASSLRQRSHQGTVSFASTLYLCPILDLLLEGVPPAWHPEIRLGLQEALVNAAKHGNQLDPCKTVVVRYELARGSYSWTIVNGGQGFKPPQHNCGERPEDFLPNSDCENGRGMCILHKIFDRVSWNEDGTQLQLHKLVRGRRPQVLVVA